MVLLKSRRPLIGQSSKALPLSEIPARLRFRVTFASEIGCFSRIEKQRSGGFLPALTPIYRPLSDGLERFSRINCDYPSVLRMWRDLRIEGGFVLQTKKPGFIYVSRAGQGCSPVGTSVAVDAALAVASKKDNCDKLASSGSGKPPLGCAHRHFKQPRLDLTSRL